LVVTTECIQLTGKDTFIMVISEVAKFRQEQEREEQAAQQGLYGLAAVARHETVTARMDRGAARLLQLIVEGRHEEAQALFSREDWC
jgi:hypothetical protein